MTDETVPIIDDGIEKLLDKYSPSELDSQMSRLCPFYEDDDRKLTSAYGSIHRFVQSRLLARLQLVLDGLSVSGEVEGENGERIDGTVGRYRVAVNGKKIEIQTGDGEEVRELAVLEVKTGEVGPLQPAAYAYRWSLPVIVAEMKTGDVHLVDRETARKFLSEAAAHIEDMERLREKGQKVPDYYQCRDCGDVDCEHYKERENLSGNSIVKKKSEILKNIDSVVGGISSTVCEILDRSRVSAKGIEAKGGNPGE